jgi:UDP-N-acetylglucosamine acyltransferase
LKRAYKIIFRQNLTVQQAIEALMVLQEDGDCVSILIDMLRDSSRGIVR